MATMQLMFEKLLTTSDEKWFTFDANYLWTLEIVGGTADSTLTLYIPTSGQTIGSNTEWYRFRASQVVAGAKIVEDQIFTPQGRDLRAFVSVAGVVIVGYGLRL